MIDAVRRVRGLLEQIESRTGVTVLYAIESGSRAWGFESPDSDFDVRFIYRDPPERAFSLTAPRDVIEVRSTLAPGDAASLPIDMVGWSLKKALGLGLASNPQLAEWSRLDRHYAVDPDFRQELRHLASFASPRALAHHYRGLAKKTLHDYLARDEDPVGKKYLYAIRPILAAEWMLDHPHPGSTPPVPFAELRREVRTDPMISEQIDELLAWKVARDEERGRRRFPLLDGWIRGSLDRLEEEVPGLPDPHIERAVAEKIWELHYPEIFRSEPDPGPEVSVPDRIHAETPNF